MKFDTRSPLPAARPTQAGHSYHGLVKDGGLTLPNGQVINYSVTGISTILKVPGWDRPEQYDPTTGHRWLPYAIYQRAAFFSGCYLYGRFSNNCDWLVAFGPADVWTVEVTAAGLTLESLNRKAKRVFALNWGPVANAFKPNGGWKWSLAAVSTSGNAAVLSFVGEFSINAVTLQLTPNGATISFNERGTSGARSGYYFERRLKVAAYPYGREIVPVFCESVMLSSTTEEIPEVPGVEGAKTRYTALFEWKIGTVKLGQFWVEHIDRGPLAGMVNTRTLQIQSGALQAPNFLWSQDILFEVVGDGLVTVASRIGLELVTYGVVDLVAGTGTLWPAGATHVAVHPVTRQIVFNSGPVCFA